MSYLSGQQNRMQESPARPALEGLDAAECPILQTGPRTIVSTASRSVDGPQKGLRQGLGTRRCA